MSFDTVFDFLKKLSKNNNREWFEKNKPRYQEVKTFFDEFAVAMLHEMIAFDESLAGQDPKKLTFRIYRDVRFSKDKSPYKKNMSAAFSSVGKGLAKPGYYFHIEPGNKSFVGIGMYMPMPEYLSKIRQEIDYNGNDLKKIFNEKKFKSNFKNFWSDDALKNAPKGFPKDHPHVEWLKLKSFIVTKTFSDDEVKHKRFLQHVTGVMKSGKPLNDFLKESISD